MIKYEVYEGVFDMDFADTSATLVDATEKGRLRNIINNLDMYADNIKNFLYITNMVKIYLIASKIVNTIDIVYFII